MPVKCEEHKRWSVCIVGTFGGGSHLCLLRDTWPPSLCHVQYEQRAGLEMAKPGFEEGL